MKLDVIEVPSQATGGAGTGDAGARDEPHTRLDPEAAWQRAGDLGAAAASAWLDLTSGDDREHRGAIAETLAELKRELAGPDPTPLGRLAVERVGIAWLVAGYSDAAVAAARGRGLTSNQFGQLQRRQERAARGFESAVKLLKSVRSLVIPARDPGNPTRLSKPKPGGTSPWVQTRLGTRKGRGVEQATID